MQDIKPIGFNPHSVLLKEPYSFVRLEVIRTGSSWYVEAWFEWTDRCYPLLIVGGLPNFRFAWVFAINWLRQGKYM